MNHLEPVEIYEDGGSASTGAVSNAYREGWERIFGSRPSEVN